MKDLMKEFVWAVYIKSEDFKLKMRKKTLEQDEFFLRATRIEIPASITAVGFYKKMGYDYKDGIAKIDEEQVYRLEKFR